MDIKFLYETTEMTMQNIANHLGIPYKHVHKYVQKHYTKDERDARKRTTYRNSKLGSKNPMLGKTGTEHPRYIGDVSDSKGYLMRVKPDWYTGRKASHHVFVHHIVVCEALSLTQIPSGFVVHHCDGNPHNNVFENLVLMTISDHMRLHSLEGATTISKESTLKWVEAHGSPFRRDDIVYSV